MAVTGTGWPSHASVTHQYHENYARRILYAYMPCPDFQGVDYVHAVVEQHYNNSFAAALKDFVSLENLWCPPWIQRNYEVKNGLQEDVKKKDSEQNKDKCHGEDKTKDVERNDEKERMILAR